MRWCVFLLGAAALYGQVAEGNIVDSISGAPVAWAYVSLPEQSGSPPSSARSDLGGHFRISLTHTDIERAWLSVSRSGYLAFSQRLPAPSSPELLDLRITLTPQAVIAGRIEDEDGFPVAFVSVQAFHYLRVGNRMELRSSGSAGLRGLGEYRISGLPAGSYYIRISSIDGLELWDLRYAPEFYGGTTTPQGASLVEVKVGETRSGIDFHLKRCQGVKITAQVTSPAPWGKPEQVGVTLRSEFGFWRRAAPEADATYVFPHVPQGTYDILATARFPSLGRSLSAKRHIEVAAADLSGLVLDFDSELGVEVGGRVLSDGVPARCPYAIGLRQRSDIVPTLGTKSGPDGTFSIERVKPGNYRLIVQAEQVNEPPSACREVTLSARLGDKDLLANTFDVGTVPVGPLQILVTAKVGTLSGSIVNFADKKPAWVQLIFEQVPGGRMFSTMVFAKGDFNQLLLPGDYHIYSAVNPQQSWALADPAYRAQHSNDLPMVRILEGKTVPIKLILPK
jgi:hypothetical protein